MLKKEVSYSEHAITISYLIIRILNENSNTIIRLFYDLYINKAIYTDKALQTKHQISSESYYYRLKAEKFVRLLKVNEKILKSNIAKLNISVACELILTIYHEFYPKSDIGDLQNVDVKNK